MFLRTIQFHPSSGPNKTKGELQSRVEQLSIFLVLGPPEDQDQEDEDEDEEEEEGGCVLFK